MTARAPRKGARIPPRPPPLLHPAVELSNPTLPTGPRTPKLLPGRHTTPTQPRPSRRLRRPLPRTRCPPLPQRRGPSCPFPHLAPRPGDVGKAAPALPSAAARAALSPPGRGSEA